MEITDFDQSIPGFQECDEDVETWTACDAEDCRFQMLNDDEIVTSVQEESDPVDNETGISGLSILMVKVTVSWLACHEIEPSATENWLCSGDPLNVKSVQAHKRSPVGMVRKLGDESTDSSIVLVT
ncbi:uncharacterized protein TNCV_3503881 [Trichonephila clavipes]|uniref:Uncharacterized protein n=1 Tax=Trichonephila clavipes TaxID=2585209 RepID=A0A8X6RVD3_TRICX|nr:uncharacterized protein TNCV_3503881 [Trichonephila clavipes]